jgi:hypothetical protein
MNRPISDSLVNKLLIIFFTSSLLAACGGSDQSSEFPIVTSLDLMPGLEIKTGETLVVRSDCKYCDAAKTRYEWKIKGVDQAVSGDNYYRIPTEYVAKEISITATAVGLDGSTGGAITRTYALNRVKEITGNYHAFAALKFNGSVVTWGDSSYGGDSRAVASQLVNVQSISAASRTFAAIKTDGSVVIWGDYSDAGDSSAVASELTQVQSISATNTAFAGIKSDGTVVSWGDGDKGETAAQLQFN